MNRPRSLVVTAALGIVALLPAITWAQTAPRTTAAHRPIRIAVLKFEHETVTFLPYDTTTEDFIYEGSPARGEALLSSQSYDVSRSSMAGFVKVAREQANVELVGIESPL